MLAVYGGAAALLLLAAGWLCLDAVQAAVRRQRALHKLPSPATGLLGHLQMLRPDLHRFMRNTAKQLGGVYRLRVLWQQVRHRADLRLFPRALAAWSCPRSESRVLAAGGCDRCPRHPPGACLDGRRC